MSGVWIAGGRGWMAEPGGESHLRGPPDPRGLRVQHGLSHRADVPRCQGLSDLGGNQRDPAHGDRPATVEGVLTVRRARLARHAGGICGASRAVLPVPHRLRSMRPGETVTAFRLVVPGPANGIANSVNVMVRICRKSRDVRELDAEDRASAARRDDRDEARGAFQDEMRLELLHRQHRVRRGRGSRDPSGAGAANTRVAAPIGASIFSVSPLCVLAGTYRAVVVTIDINPNVYRNSPCAAPSAVHLRPAVGTLRRRLSPGDRIVRCSPASGRRAGQRKFRRPPGTNARATLVGSNRRAWRPPAPRRPDLRDRANNQTS